MAQSFFYLCVVAPDQAPVGAPSRLLPDAAAAASKGGVPTVSLVVTVSNVDAAGATYRIRNDGQGSYTDGVQGVQAILDQYGTFAFNTFASGRKAIRSVVYDFDSPVVPTNTYRPSPDNAHNYHFSTGASAFAPAVPIQNLGVNGNPQSECIYMGNSFDNATTHWRVSFHKGEEDVSGTPTAFAVVQRTSVTPATWTVAPVGACSPNSNVGALRSADGAVLYGYYNLPFLFTITAR